MSATANAHLDLNPNLATFWVKKLSIEIDFAPLE